MKLKSDIQLSPEQQAVLKLIKKGHNVLVTGSAGTGKSTLLRELSAQHKGQLPIVASTGIAAVNVQGTTIHSWAGLGMGEETAEQIVDRIKSRKVAFNRIKKATILALDEVSMIHGDLLELMEQVFRLVKGSQKPFGGIQMVMFGDFLQLPPVARDKPQRFAFQSECWRNADVKTCLLTRVFRQSDQVFSDALNHIRLGNIPSDVHELLKSRLKVVDSSPEIEPVTVFTHNADVDRLNNERLAKIKGKAHRWNARDTGQQSYVSNLQKHCLAPETLELKVGAQVMCLWNIEPEYGIANGSIGTVTDISSETGLPVVLFTNGEEMEISRREWQIKIGGEVVASRIQIPLRLAWAITAHKSQGMTLDKIRVHLDKAFEYGQSYVALSRARTLDGLFIESSKFGCIKAHPDAVEFYQNAS